MAADSTPTKNILVVGSANQDLVSYTPRLPKPGETVLGHSFKTSCGGKGANQAVAAGLLGIANEVRMLCKVGKDSFGDTLLAQFDQSGVLYNKETVYSTTGTVTGNAAIFVDDAGENCIVVTPGANSEITPQYVRETMQALKANPPMIVIVQLEVSLDSALEALKQGKALGAMTIFNPAPAPSCKLDDAFYQYSDIVIPNQTELKELTNYDFKGEDTKESRARHLLDKGIGEAVIVTLGARGAMVVPKGEVKPQIVSAPKNLPCNDLPVVDTVGAGDSFCGSLSAYLTTGLTLTQAAQYACGVASMSVRKNGAQTSYPSYDELPDQLKLKDKILR